MSMKLRRLVGFVGKIHASGEAELTFWDPSEADRTWTRIFKVDLVKKSKITYEGQPFEMLIGMHDGKQHLEIIPASETGTARLIAGIDYDLI